MWGRQRQIDVRHRTRQMWDKIETDVKQIDVRDRQMWDRDRCRTETARQINVRQMDRCLADLRQKDRDIQYDTETDRQVWDRPGRPPASDCCTNAGSYQCLWPKCDQCITDPMMHLGDTHSFRESQRADASLKCPQTDDLQSGQADAVPDANMRLQRLKTTVEDRWFPFSMSQSFWASSWMFTTFTLYYLIHIYILKTIVSSFFNSTIIHIILAFIDRLISCSLVHAEGKWSINIGHTFCWQN